MIDERNLIPTCLGQHPCGIYSLAATENLRWVLTGSADGQIRKFDFFASVNGAQKLTQAQMVGYPETVTKSAIQIAQWENDESLFNASPTRDDDEIEDEDVNEIAKYWTKTRLSPVYSLACHSEALWALSGTKTGNVCLWTVRHDQGTCLHVFTGHHKQPVGVIELLKDEQSFISASWDASMKLFDLNTGKVLRDFPGHKSQITSVKFHPTDENIFLSSSFDGLVCIWDKRQEAAVRLFDNAKNNIPPFCLSACWAMKGDFIYCARRDESVDEWDVKSGQLTGRVLKLPANSGPVSYLQCLGDSNILCASIDNMRLWDLNATAKEYLPPFRIIPGHHGGMISSLLYRKNFLITTSGNKGLQGYPETNQLSIYENKP